jgi:hypothetical protein
MRTLKLMTSSSFTNENYPQGTIELVGIRFRYFLRWVNSSWLCFDVVKSSIDHFFKVKSNYLVDLHVLEENPSLCEVDLVDYKS